jgi:hypothetical protein
MRYACTLGANQRMTMATPNKVKALLAAPKVPVGGWGSQPVRRAEAAPNDRQAPAKASLPPMLSHQVPIEWP